MSIIWIRAGGCKYVAELDDSDISNAIWLSTPFKARINMLGDQIYFEMPLDAKMPEERQTVFGIGDIAYWPGVGALCIFFGPTPFSGEDGLPVSRYPLVRIGGIFGDCSGLRDVGDRQVVSLERPF